MVTARVLVVLNVNETGPTLNPIHEGYTVPNVSQITTAGTGDRTRDSGVAGGCGNNCAPLPHTDNLSRPASVNCGF